VSFVPKELETHIDWRASDVADPATWTLMLTDADQRELDHALHVAKSVSDNLLDIRKESFPLGGLVAKLADVERELIDGRGFMRIGPLDTRRYSDDDLTLLYWGIGLYLGDPCPQNKNGHMMVDVTDLGKKNNDPTLRSHEIGLIGIDYHSDISDLVGLMCLRPAKSGGLSCVANVVAIHNELVRTRPDLVAALYNPVPWDFRGSQPPGWPPYYMRAVFTEREGRLFTLFVPQFIKLSQRHPEAPRLSALEHEAIDTVHEMARRPEFNVYMEIPPGCIQFINNYHVLHGRQPYEDDVAHGYKRHLKRLWLSTHPIKSRPTWGTRQSL
jgi:hypothetical protein